MKFLKNAKRMVGSALVVTGLTLLGFWFFRTPSREITRAELDQFVEAKTLTDGRVRPTPYAGIYRVEGKRKLPGKSENVFLTTHLDEVQVKTLFNQSWAKVEIPGEGVAGKWVVVLSNLLIVGVVSLREALTFHASFDYGPDADFAQGDRRLFSAPSMKHPRTGTPGLPTNGVVSIAKGEGKFGDALRFHRKAPELVFFQGERNFPYAKSNWSGTVSFWLRLDPDTDLEAGYCDPLQITSREWNDASFWVDFSKDDRPRHFRLGAFADRAVWDPNQRNYDALPASERPVVTVTRPPFSRDRWTHVVFTFANFNTGKKDGAATLYLDGKSQGTMSGWQQTVTWEPAQVLAMLGISYTGLFDELAFFNRSLTATEVGQLFARPGGVATLRE